MHKLLIVDDSNIIRRKIERSVDISDIAIVGSAANGLEAVRLFKRHRPSAVTMDITMPHMDGIQCVEELIKIDSQVRILVISALADKATAIEAIMKGANGFLCKPFTNQELNAALRELLSLGAGSQGIG